MEPSESRLDLIAYQTGRADRIRMIPSERWRQWMDATGDRFANRCLPLLMANEAGWTLLNPVGFAATWNGGPHWRDITLEFDDSLGRRPLVESNFGYGIISWGITMLFRTPPGYNLLARGPANLPKDGISALEGLVETDWSVSTFTMNWQITRASHPVRFETEEPFCMIVPQRRGELERFRPILRDLSSAPSLKAGANAFWDRRDDLQKRKFIADFVGPKAKAWLEWEATYFRGLDADGVRFSEHQTKLRLATALDERKVGSPDGEGASGAEPQAGQSGIEDAGATFRVRAPVRFRSFRSGTVVLNLENGQHFELNPTAGRMLELLADTHSVRQTSRAIAVAIHGAEAEAIYDDVAALAAQLVELGILEPGEPPTELP